MMLEKTTGFEIPQKEDISKEAPTSVDVAGKYLKDLITEESWLLFQLLKSFMTLIPSKITFVM